MNLLRMDCDTYPMNDFERKTFTDAGITNIVEIGGWDPAEIIEADPDVIAVVPGYLQEEVLAKLNNCKVILRMGTGFDKIDIEAAANQGIAVTNAPVYCMHEVAEHAISLMFAASRKLEPMVASMHDGTWVEAKRNVRVNRIFGKTLGIVGFGKIGQELGRLAAGIGMEVIAFDEYAHPEVEYDMSRVDFEQLLEMSDVVSVNCPLTPSTRELFGCREFERMKKNAIFINVARGAICDEQALADALRKREIAFAGIDVYESIDVFSVPKSAPYEGVYAGLDNVILTPHCASFSDEAWEECALTSAQQMQEAMRGVIPKYCVNKEALKKVLGEKS